MHWLERYKSKLRSPQEAVKLISSGQRVYVHPGCAVPEVLVNAMSERYLELEDVEVIHLLTVGKAAYSVPEMEGHFRHNAVFIGAVIIAHLLGAGQTLLDMLAFLYVMLRIFYIMMYVSNMPTARSAVWGAAFFVNIAILFVGYH